MNYVIMLVGLLVLLFSACSTKELIIPEVVVTDQGQFTKLNSEQIFVSTNDSVKVEIKNQETQKTITRKRILRNQATNNYKFESDSLFINDSNFHAASGVGNIKSIAFKGIYDSDLGYVNENELLEFVESNYKKPIALNNIIGRAGIGIMVGGALSVIAPLLATLIECSGF